jgi:hypothetical protein
LSRRQQNDLNTGLGCLVLLIAGVAIVDPRAFVALVVVLVIAAFFGVLLNWRRKHDRLQAQEEFRERVRQRQAELQEEAQQREAEKRRRIEAMLHPDRVRDEIHYMSGPEFERFMADLLRQKGYQVEETPLSGDQGVDLVLPDLDGKRVVIQLKRWTGPVGNNAIQATFAGMAHYQADEGWIITTSTFTKSARELARSTSVRLIDKDELTDWLEGLREEAEGAPDELPTFESGSGGIAGMGVGVDDVLASVRGVVDLSPHEALDEAQDFLTRQGYSVTYRTTTTLTVKRQVSDNATGQGSIFELIVIALPQSGGGIRIKVRGNDREAVRDQQAAWLEWSETLPKR